MEFLIYIWWVIKFSTFLFISLLISLATGAVLINILGLIIKIIWEITDFIKEKKKGELVIKGGIANKSIAKNKSSCKR